jgi:hypothetical protein
MNDDYLWSGRGKPDPDVERLEGLLRRFRHEPSAWNAGEHAPAPRKRRARALAWSGSRLSRSQPSSGGSPAEAAKAGRWRRLPGDRRSEASAKGRHLARARARPTPHQASLLIGASARWRSAWLERPPVRADATDNLRARAGMPCAIWAPPRLSSWNALGDRG